MNTTEVIPSSSVEAIVAERDAIVAAAEKVADLIAKCPEGFPSMWLSLHGNHVHYDTAIVVREADVAAWNRLLAETGLWSFMDKTAREAWRKQIESPRHGKAEPIPPFTLEAAAHMAEKLHGERVMMVARGVSEVHRKLAPNYKRNEVNRFGKRMVITSLGTVWRNTSTLSINYNTCETLDDLSRFLHLTHGEPEPDHRQGAYSILLKVDNQAPIDVDFRFWTIRLYKNGNGHLTFKREDDVERLNRLLARSAANTVPDTERTRQF